MSIFNVHSQSSLLSSLSFTTDSSKKAISIEIFADPISSEDVVNRVSAIAGPVDAYFWYEGAFLLKECAEFMKTAILGPLHRKKSDIKLYLYSLKAWHCRSNIDAMATSTPIGDAINRINRTAVEMIHSTSFFHYCAEQKEGDFYQFLNEKLPQKKWLFKLSEGHFLCGVTVKDLFKGESSALDFIQDVDLAQAYSHMQYLEAYYLVRKSVQDAISRRESSISIAFILPNDELKYYKDFPEDIEEMLQIDFHSDLEKVKISISFHSFIYKNSITARPYIDRSKNPPSVNVEDIPSHFDFLTNRVISERNSGLETSIFLKDVDHDINGWRAQEHLHAKNDDAGQSSCGVIKREIASTTNSKQEKPKIPKDMIHDINGWG